jgi:hypothetical protein
MWGSRIRFAGNGGKEFFRQAPRPAGCGREAKTRVQQILHLTCKNIDNHAYFSICFFFLLPKSSLYLHFVHNRIPRYVSSDCLLRCLPPYGPWACACLTFYQMPRDGRLRPASGLPSLGIHVNLSRAGPALRLGMSIAWSPQSSQPCKIRARAIFSATEKACLSTSSLEVGN